MAHLCPKCKQPIAWSAVAMKMIKLILIILQAYLHHN